MTILHQIGAVIRQALLTVPLAAVKTALLMFLVGLIFWIWRQQSPTEETSQATSRQFWQVKLWASIAALLQLAIYTVFA